MTFAELLEQAIALLQRHGRITYRALQRQFALDEATLHDLQEAMRFAYPQIMEEAGRGLIWSPVGRSQAGLSRPAVVGSPPEAERRHLTVLFCDLVDSTVLAGQLDPEEYREVMRAYHGVCSEVVQHFDGYVAQLLGDALLVYFGWPQAHEDDAQRAVHTGLGFLSVLGPLNTRLHQDYGIQLAIRVGIHTGMVVIGAMGDSAHSTQLALGETPNVAARLQALATPNRVLLSVDTYRLVQGYFTVEDGGPQWLKGVAAPLHVYRVIEARAALSRLEVGTATGLTPLVGREAEVAWLLDAWQRGSGRQQPMVLVSGEAGIGKSRLLHILKTHVAAASGHCLECRCSPYAQHTALYPVVELIERTAAWRREDTVEEKLARLEQLFEHSGLPLADTVPFVAPLLSLPVPRARYPQLPLSPQRQRQRTLETVLAWIAAQASRQPLLFLVEDVHWADPSTLELLQLLNTPRHVVRGLTVLTCRREFHPPAGWLTSLQTLSLARLPRSQVEQMLTLLAGGKRLPAEVVEHLVEKADGIPLFIEEMTKTLLESQLLHQTDRDYVITGDLSPLAIPATLHDSLLARLDRLLTAKGVAQLAATLGRQFSYEFLQAVAQLDDATLQRELARLVQAELLLQQGGPPHATYTFKHALVQEAAYQSLLKRTRQQYHHRAAQVLESQFAEVRAARPELLAHHYKEAGRPAEATAYWYLAGQQALQRSANAEAIAHLTAALTLLATLPDSVTRQQQELHLLTALGPALVATRGYAAAEVERTYARARALCQQVQDLQQLSQTLWGLWGFYLVRGELHIAQELADQLFTLVQGRDDPALGTEVYRRLGITAFYRGELVQARTYLTQGIAYYEQQPSCLHLAPPSFVSDPRVICQAFLAHTLWLLGYPEQAVQHSQAALSLAQTLAHPFTLALALFYASRLHQYRGEGTMTHTYAEALLALASEQGFTQWTFEGTLLRGGSLVTQGDIEAGITQIQDGLMVWRRTAGTLGVPWYLALLATAQIQARQYQHAWPVLHEATEIMDKTAERWWQAEIYRLTGECLLPARSEEAESYFVRALDTARQQQARCLELRAAMSLCRLWQQQGKPAQARVLLAEVYGWFTEGLATADLQGARRLLDTLQ